MAGQEMSVIGHLGELRKRLIYTALFFIGFLIVGLTFTKEIYLFFVKDLDTKLAVLGPSDILWIYFIIAIVFSAVLTIPFAAFQIWLFVKPALSSYEKKYTLLFIPLMFILFLGGLVFGYFVIFPIVFNFLTTLGEDMFVTMFTTQKYFSFVFNMTVPFAVLFELPLVVMFLTMLGVVNPMYLSKIRRYAYFVLVVIAICISPPDFISDFVIAIPLLVIYEISITASRIVYKRKLRRQVKEANEG